MIVLSVFALVHAVFFFFLAYNWRQLATVALNPDSTFPAVTVLIPVRNEALKIRDLLNTLQHQEYPAEKITVIVIDDHSQDNTAEVVRQLVPTYQYTLQVASLQAPHAGKKAAATLGVELAQTDLILCTDGDCTLPSRWVRAHTDWMCQQGAQMVSAPVRMVPSNGLGRLQAIEFSGLIGYGGITLSIGQPGMCNGANMAYRKAAFLAVGGYEGNAHIPTGDDEFLLQKISKAYPGQVSFLKSKDAIVSTPAKQNFLELWGQRVRWTSKWRLHQGWYIKLSAVAGFLDFASGIVLFAMLASHFYWALALLLGRLLAEYVYLRSTASFLGVVSRGVDFLLIGLIYPFYAVFLGIASIFGKYSWKGRNYK
ncbi:MAG: glycosyltransferase [Cyclobacteriaceae bacterium]|nr:glycosyltransferase [Cyclobacteriaceae bacterium]